MITELQEINEDLKINTARIVFTEEALTTEWRDAEISKLQTRIEALAEEVAGIQRKHTEAPNVLVQLKQRREKLLQSRRVNTDATIRQLLKLQKQVEELSNVDPS